MDSPGAHIGDMHSLFHHSLIQSLPALSPFAKPRARCFFGDVFRGISSSSPLFLKIRNMLDNILKLRGWSRRPQAPSLSPSRLLPGQEGRRRPPFLALGRSGQCVKDVLHTFSFWLLVSAFVPDFIFGRGISKLLLLSLLSSVPFSPRLSHSPCFCLCLSFSFSLSLWFFEVASSFFCISSILLIQSLSISLSSIRLVLHVIPFTSPLLSSLFFLYLTSFPLFPFFIFVIHILINSCWLPCYKFSLSSYCLYNLSHTLCYTPAVDCRKHCRRWYIRS